MASAKKQPAVSFDEIIQSDRQKKQHEQLANQILGKNRKDRRASAPGPGAGQKMQSVKPGSLASRIGVPKRSASATFRSTQKQNPVPATVASGRSRAKPTHQSRPNAQRLLAALESGDPQATVHRSGSGLSIKGASGPFVVVGSNFAPGTTAADIQSALEPVSGPMLSCRVIAQRPTVTAEFAYAEKWTAENVVANFHNQRADGRLLSMKLKSGESSTPDNAQNPFNGLREQADRERRSRRVETNVQDGRYGFDNQGDLLSKQTSKSGLYSDEMMVDAPPRHNQNRRRRNR